MKAANDETTLLEEVRQTHVEMHYITGAYMEEFGQKSNLFQIKQVAESIVKRLEASACTLASHEESELGSKCVYHKHISKGNKMHGDIRCKHKSYKIYTSTHVTHLNTDFPFVRSSVTLNLSLSTKWKNPSLTFSWPHSNTYISNKVAAGLILVILQL